MTEHSEVNLLCRTIALSAKLKGRFFLAALQACLQKLTNKIDDLPPGRAGDCKPLPQDQPE
jgi:hypothetical protein